MVEVQSKPIGEEFDKLREKYFQEALRHQKFLSQIEERADKTYILDLTDDNANRLCTIRLRKLRHGEAMLLHRLQFYHKIIQGKNLEPEEKAQYEALKAELVKMTISDKNQWEDHLSKHPELLTPVYNAVLAISGMTEGFAKDLEEFMNEEFGFGYGQIWFMLFGRTPSEIADLPETDVQAITMWIHKWSEKVGENVRT